MIDQKCKHVNWSVNPAVPISTVSLGTLWGLMLWTACGQSLVAETATYELTFEATWSAETHPDDFPPNPHFSGLVGATHDNTVQLWAAGETASAGIEQMAETGARSQMQEEITTLIDQGSVDQVLLGPGIGHSPNHADMTFDVEESHSLLSIVSMIAPSPDWFVGTQGLNLRDPSQGWIPRIEFSLLPYDAGTDSGSSYTSPNADTSPPEPIHRIETAPFANTGPLGQFVLLRQIEGDLTRDGRRDREDLDILSRAVREGQSGSMYDLDGNGTVDSMDRLYWIESLEQTVLGDANLNGLFNSEDLVIVFQAGEYEDDIANNSTWAEGDWDGDGDFLSGDLVAAFARGSYEDTAEKNRAVAVPEPVVGLWHLWLSVAAWVIRNRKRSTRPSCCADRQAHGERVRLAV